MLRQVFLIVGAIVLIAGVDCRPSVCKARDYVKSESGKQAEQKAPEKFDRFEIGEIEETPPPELDIDPMLERPAQAASGPDVGFGGRGRGSRKAMLATGGGNKDSERAVTASLIWLANHQDHDGHWSLQNYTHRCTDKTCTGTGSVSTDVGATAMCLLPFLAAGQTHKSRGPYKTHILQGVQWLIRHQQPDGNLAKGAPQMMYSHGLASIALSEAYALTGDKQVGMAAQDAVNFIVAAQNAADGGWRYNPKDPGDTSVTGWQLMALKSAHMAGLNLGGAVFVGHRQVGGFGCCSRRHTVFLPTWRGRRAVNDCRRPALPTIPRREARRPHAYRRHEVPDGKHA